VIYNTIFGIYHKALGHSQRAHDSAQQGTGKKDGPYHRLPVYDKVKKCKQNGKDANGKQNADILFLRYFDLHNPTPFHRLLFIF
jgi:hypothetical protein